MSSYSMDTLIAERELLNLLAAFDDAAIRTDLETFRNLWTEDAVWEIGDPMPMRAEGREAIANVVRVAHRLKRVALAPGNRWPPLADRQARAAAEAARFLTSDTQVLPIRVPEGRRAIYETKL